MEPLHGHLGQLKPVRRCLTWGSLLGLSQSHTAARRSQGCRCPASSPAGKRKCFVPVFPAWSPSIFWLGCPSHLSTLEPSQLDRAGGAQVPPKARDVTCRWRDGRRERTHTDGPRHSAWPHNDLPGASLQACQWLLGLCEARATRPALAPEAPGQED